MRISDWSSDVCSSDLLDARTQRRVDAGRMVKLGARGDDVAVGFEQTAELIGVDRLRHVDHAIRLRRQDLVDIAPRLHADRRQPATLAGIASGLGLARPLTNSEARRVANANVNT